jgi:hypothetical protein
MRSRTFSASPGARDISSRTHISAVATPPGWLQCGFGEGDRVHIKGGREAMRLTEKTRNGPVLKL